MSAWQRLLSLCKVKLVDDTGRAQRAQLDLGPKLPAGQAEIHDGAVSILPFGLASNPPAGADGLAIFLDAQRSQGLLLGVVADSRLKSLEPGDVALYDVRGAYVKLTKDGLLIDCAGLDAKVQNFKSLTVDGDLKVTGKIEAEKSISTKDTISADKAISSKDTITARSGGTKAELGAVRDAYVQHKHIGVQTGPGVTGPSDKISV